MLWARYDVFAGICKEKLKIVTCFARRKKSFRVFLCGAQSTLRFRVFPCKCQPKSIVMRLKHVTNARRATMKCQISLSHNPGTVETYDIRARCCWSRAGPVKKCHFHGTWIATKRCHSFAVKHDYKRDRRADCSWARLVNPEVKASDVLLFGLHPMKPETFLVGSEAYKLEMKASHMLLRGLHQPKNPETIC